MNRLLKIKNFSLIELLIVIGILGTLAALILPAFHNTSDEAKKTAAISEMHDIQRAFGRFAADNINILKKTTAKNGEKTNTYLEDIALHGFWPLIIQSHPRYEESAYANFKYPDFSHDTQFGWRGQYLEYEGVSKIAAPSLVFDNKSNLGAQTPDKNSSVKVPVLLDPFGSYYRILIPAKRTENGNSLNLYERLQRMTIVCCGANRVLNTTSDSFLAADDDNYIKNINADDIAGQGDDIILRLLPSGL